MINQWPFYFLFPKYLDCMGPRHHEIGLISFAITPNDAIGKYVIPISTILGSIRLEVLFPKGVTSLPGR